MKFIFFLLFVLSTVLTFAQINTSEKRIEIDLKDGYNNENVYEFGSNGFLITSQSDKPINGLVEFRFQRFSTDLAFVDEQIYELPKGFTETQSFIEGEVLYKLITNSFGKYSILQYNIKTGEFSQIDGDCEKSLTFQFFEVANGHAMITGRYKSKTTMINLDLKSGTLNTSQLFMDGIDSKKLDISNLQYNKNSESFYVSICAFVSRKVVKWYLNQYDLFGNLINTKPFDVDLDKDLKTSSVAALDEKDVLISGVYSNKRGSASTGLYIATTMDGAIQEPRFYNFIDLENFLSYLPERTKDRIEKKQERMSDRGKELAVSYNMAIHDIIPCGEDYLFLGEAYYSTYRTESRTTYVNGQRTTTYVQVFDGFQYTHALIAKFNKKGELLWSQCFKMYPNYKPFYVKRFIRIAGKTQKGIKLVFADGGHIYGKEIDFDGNVISDKTSAEINGSLENDKVKGTYSEIIYWYDNYFLSYGIQRIKNTKDEDVKRKRNVLFINKIMFE